MTHYTKILLAGPKKSLPSVLKGSSTQSLLSEYNRLWKLASPPFNNWNSVKQQIDSFVQSLQGLSKEDVKELVIATGSIPNSSSKKGMIDQMVHRIDATYRAYIGNRV